MHALNLLTEKEQQDLSRRLKNTDAEWKLIDALGDKLGSLDSNLRTIDRNLSGKLHPAFNPILLLQEVNDLLKGVVNLHDFLHAAARAQEKT